MSTKAFSIIARLGPYPFLMQEISFDSPLSEIESILKLNNWIDTTHEEVQKLEKPGEGNMNVVMRIVTNKTSLILKQSRSYVNKYKDIQAPLDRIHTEYTFYKALESHPVQGYFPNIIGYIEDHHLLAMEDIGDSQDMSYIYSEQNINNESVNTLVQILRDLHSLESPQDYPSNLELRKLNHQHIFVLPFMEDNGFSLDDIQDGLQELSQVYKNDTALKNEISTIGELYLSDGDTLLHGDYYPGSWMKNAQQLYVLDPEFSFIGCKEFDLGVMAAHLEMSGLNNASQIVLQKYNAETDSKLTSQITGIEIMRRLIGLAQLPLNMDLKRKKELLELAYRMIMTPAAFL